jgi:hypothetical protein
MRKLLRYPYKNESEKKSINTNFEKDKYWTVKLTLLKKNVKKKTKVN